MRVDRPSGRLEAAEFVASPNQDARPHAADISLIVVHGISLPPSVFGGEAIEQLFTNRLDPTAHPYYATLGGLKVSAHALIRRDGRIIQYVPFHKRAWHAGRSRYRGREGCNDFSIGIELEGADDVAYEDRQYAALNALIAALRAAYPGLADIVGHCDIAPDRKTDPGPAFDWRRVVLPGAKSA